MKYANILIGLIILITLTVIYHYHISPLLQLTTVTASTPGAPVREWNVISEFQNKKEAAELLSRVNTRMIEFMRYLKKKYHIDEPDDIIAAEGVEHQHIVNLPNDVYNMIGHLLDNYNPDVFYENDPRYTSETSYTVNKGDSMYVCLRRKDDPTKLVDENDLFFVLLHESAHIANYRGFGHQNDFWEAFAFILHEAQLSGLYKPVDYSKFPITYCGLFVSYNPLFDPLLHKLWVD